MSSRLSIAAFAVETEKKRERVPSDECRENDKTEEDKKKVDEMCFLLCSKYK